MPKGHHKKRERQKDRHPKKERKKKNETQTSIILNWARDHKREREREREGEREREEKRRDAFELENWGLCVCVVGAKLLVVVCRFVVKEISPSPHNSHAKGLFPCRSSDVCSSA